MHLFSHVIYITAQQAAQLGRAFRPPVSRPVRLKGKYRMIKTNSILLACITSFFIIPVNFTYAQKKLFQEPASIGKKGLNNPIVDTGQVRCFDNSREILCPKPGQPF